MKLAKSTMIAAFCVAALAAGCGPKHPAAQISDAKASLANGADFLVGNGRAVIEYNNSGNVAGCRLCHEIQSLLHDALLDVEFVALGFARQVGI